MFQEAATVLGPAPAPPAEIVPGGRREGSVEIGLREEGVVLGFLLYEIKQDELMGNSGQPETCMLLPKSSNERKLRASKRGFLFLSGSLSSDV